MQIPERVPLAAQTAVILIRQIKAGIFNYSLPSERELAATLKVSRRIIREALAHLETESWIAMNPATRTRRILGQSTSPRIGQPKHVGFILGQSPSAMSSNATAFFHSFADYCASSGCECSYHPVSQFTPQQLNRRLHEIVTAHPCDLWIGFSLLDSKPLNWLQNSGYPVIGANFVSAHPFPVIGFDYASATRHALGTLLRAGRRRIIMPTARRDDALIASCDELLSAYEIRPLVDFHHPLFDGTRHGFRRMIQQLFSARPQPDGVIVNYSNYIQAVTLQGCLMELGLRYPKDISVIQIGADSFLQMMVPAVSHYVAPYQKLSKALFDAARRFFETGKLPTTRKNIQFKFVPGESV